MLARYWRFGLMNALLLGSIATGLFGGAWLMFGFVAALIVSTLIDEASGDELSPPGAAPTAWLDAMLYATLPLIAGLSFVTAHYFGSGDPFGMVAALRGIGIDFEASRRATGPVHLAGALLGLGLMTGAAATNVAHELVHRTDNPAALLVGRWLLAFSFDTTFSIEHVYGHHRNVATDKDPASARRGEYALAFAVRSAITGNLGAWEIERARLERKGLALWSWHNRVLTGQLMSLAIAGVWTLIAGLAGLAAFAVCAVQGKLYLELVNYIEHYGLVRIPGACVEPRHSWNTYRRVTNGMLYNLARHSNHHRYARKPYWELEAEAGAPTLPHGYMTMIAASLVPPLWHRLMSPRLAHWDAELANAEERQWLAERGQLSRMAADQSRPGLTRM